MNEAKYPESEIPIRVGDRVVAFGDAGTIVFVVSRDEWRGDFQQAKDWWVSESHGKGIMFETPAVGLMLLQEDDPELELVFEHRG